MGEKKKKDCFSVKTLALRHRQEVASLTVSRLHVSHASQVLCGFSADLLIYRFEVQFLLNAQVLSLVNRIPTQTFFHYNPHIVLYVWNTIDWVPGGASTNNGNDTGVPLLGGNSGLSNEYWDWRKTEVNLWFSFLKETYTKRRHSSIDAR